MTTNPRDTQFLASAKKLQTQLTEMHRNAARNVWTLEDLHSHQATLIAQYAYDIACQTVIHTSVKLLVPDLEEHDDKP